jgi:hypothetical protein
MSICRTATVANQQFLAKWALRAETQENKYSVKEITQCTRRSDAEELIVQGRWSSVVDDEAVGEGRKWLQAKKAFEDGVSDPLFIYLL